MISQLRKLASLFDRRDKLKMGMLLGFMVVGALLDMIGVGAIPVFIAVLAIPERILEYPFLASALETLGISTGPQLVVWGCIGLIIVFFLKNAFLLFMQYVQVRVTERYGVSLAHRLFNVYMRAPYEFHLGRNTAELMRNVTLETKEIIAGVIGPLLSIVLNVMMTLFILALLVVFTPGAALGGICIVAGGSWLFMRIVKGKLRRYGKEAQRQRKISLQTVSQGLGGLQEARILGRESYFIRAFHRSLVRFARANRWKSFIMKVSNPVLEFIAVAGLLLIVLVLMYFSSDIASLVPTIALFGAAIVRMRATVSGIVGGITSIRYNIVAVDPVYDDLRLLKSREKQTAIPDVRRSTRLEKLTLTRAIVVEGLEYAYPDTVTPALRDIHLTIERGMSVAFVGSTGSGKTTLVNVLLGLLQPQRGTVTVDGVNIHEHPRAWQANIGYIPQTIYLLDDTIRRNIALGLPDREIDDEKIWTAMRAAQLADFVQILDAGVETVVGERGVRLSGGQRQRIGLARALYHNPEVLIMDEATSALDNQTESLVMEALDVLREDRTFIMIAHRLSTVRNCDRLYFLKDGHIEAVGTYDELCRRHVDFQRMAEVA